MKKNVEKNISETSSRRKFLKKAVYAAPAVVALGTLIHPSTASASSLTVINKDGTGGLF